MTSQAPASGRRLLAEHLWVALAVGACSLAIFLVVDHGNSFGSDSWAHVYAVAQNRSPAYSGRLLALLWLSILFPLFRTNLIAYHFVVVFERAATAYLLYSLVRRLSPDRPAFAFAAGLFASLFMAPDGYFIFTEWESNSNVGNLLALMLSLNFVVAYLLDSRPVRSRRILWLLAALILGGVATLIREAGLPLQVAVPVLVVLLRRGWSRANVAGLAAWLAVIGACALVYLLPFLGLAPPTYSSSNFQDLDVGRMLAASAVQFRIAYQRLLFLDFANVYEYRLPALIAAGVALAAFSLTSPRLERTEVEIEGPPGRALAHFGVWAGLGLLATWLGFSAFLVSGLAASPVRTHILSAPAEALALASVVWLVSHLAGEGRRRLIRLGGVALVAISGAVTAGQTQRALHNYGADWENAAHFVRSLAHLAPQVQSPSLFVYVENPELGETPFANGFTFQYAVRYFYADRATGLIPTDNIFDRWSAGDAGITMEERWLPEPHVFGWDEMIFVTRDDDARLRILDTLPDAFYTEARQALYRPQARIRAAFVSERVRRTFPVVDSPDWSGRKLFLAGQP